MSSPDSFAASFYQFAKTIQSYFISKFFCFASIASQDEIFQLGKKQMKTFLVFQRTKKNSQFIHSMQAAVFWWEQKKMWIQKHLLIHKKAEHFCKKPWIINYTSAKLYLHWIEDI